MRIMLDLNVLLDVPQNRAPFDQDSEEAVTIQLNHETHERHETGTEGGRRHRNREGA
jgi:hypothetical protein